MALAIGSERLHRGRHLAVVGVGATYAEMGCCIFCVSLEADIGRASCRVNGVKGFMIDSLKHIGIGSNGVAVHDCLEILGIVEGFGCSHLTDEIEVIIFFKSIEREYFRKSYHAVGCNDSREVYGSCAGYI